MYAFRLARWRAWAFAVRGFAMNAEPRSEDDEDGAHRCDCVLDGRWDSGLTSRVVPVRETRLREAGASCVT